MKISRNNEMYSVATSNQFFGAAQQRGTLLSLCSNAPESGSFVLGADYNPNSALSFQFQRHTWSNNGFRFSVLSDYMALTYEFPSASNMRLVDSSNFILGSWALSNQLSNAPAWNTFRLISIDDKLVATVNSEAYTVGVPNWNDSNVRAWPNGAYRWSSCNSTVQGSNSIKNLYCQSIVTFSDPVRFKQAVQAEIVNSEQVGVSNLRVLNAAGSNLAASNLVATNITANFFTASNVVSPNVLPWSNVVGTSNSNATFAGVTAANMTCSNLAASNLGVAAFCNVIPYSMLTGVPVTSNASFSNLSIGTFTASGNTIMTAGRTLPTGCNLDFTFGHALSNANGMLTRYTHFGDNNSSNEVRLGFLNTNPHLRFLTASDRTMEIAARTTVVPPTSTGWGLDVWGNFRCRSNALFENGMSAYGMGIMFSTELQMGSGYTKEASAGKIAYGASWATDALSIVGAGTAVNSRKINLYDNVSINGSLSTGSLTVNGAMSVGSLNPSSIRIGSGVNVSRIVAGYVTFPTTSATSASREIDLYVTVTPDNILNVQLTPNNFNIVLVSYKNLRASGTGTLITINAVWTWNTAPSWSTAFYVDYLIICGSI